MVIGPPSGDGRTPRYLAGFAVLLAVVILLETAVRFLVGANLTNSDPVAFSGEYLIGLVTAVPFVVGLGYAGYWLPGSRLEPARYPRILRWTLGVAVASLLFNLLIIAVIGASSMGMFLAWLRWAVALGAGLGLVVGVSEARVVQQSVEVERAELRTEHVAEQRDFLDYLNGLLRHEILNTTQVIAGHAELLMDAHDPESPEYDHSETIYRQSEDVTSVIQNVRTLLNAAHEESPLEPMNAVAVLADEVAKIESRYENVEVTASIPDGAYTRANSLLRQVFGNLLTNAVVHNDSDVARIRVTMTTDDDVVTVEIADNGPGIRDERAEGLFERPDSFAVDHGLGLYLVDNLVRQYGGAVELVETGDDGSVFAVELPRAPETAVDDGERDRVAPEPLTGKFE